MQNQTVQQFFERLRTDFPFYCRTVIEIKDKAGNLCKFHHNRMQQRLWEWYKEDIAAGRGIDWYVVKGRQMGSTLFFTVLFYWLVTLWSNRNAAVVAQDEKAAHALGGKIQNYYQRSTPQFRPSYRIMNREQIHFATSLDEFKRTGDIGLDCHLDTFSIDTKNLGRSYTFQLMLFTEYSMYESVVADVEDRLDSIYNTMEDNLTNVVVRETTPKGEGKAKADWDDAENGQRKIFISWVAMENYRIELLPSQYFDLSENEDTRYGDELEERKKIIKQLSIWWPELDTEAEIEHEVYCRLAWRRRRIDKKLSGKKLKFKQEYPTSIEDAFTFSVDPIFPLESLIKLEKHLDTANYPSINFAYEHDDNEKDITRKFYEDTYGKLVVYESPVPGITYVIGADGAQGIKGGDESSAVVLRLPELVEVARYSDVVIPDKFAGILNYLGLLYNNAFLGCEDNDKGGYAALEKLVNFYHYPNLYHRINPMKPTAEGDIRYGWHTGPETRQIMIDDFTVSLEEGNILIKSKNILTQCKTFVMIKGKPQAMPGKHDDLVIAIMIARQMANAVHIHKPVAPPTRAPKWSIEWHLQRMQQQAGQRTTMNRSFR